MANNEFEELLIDEMLVEEAEGEKERIATVCNTRKHRKSKQDMYRKNFHVYIPAVKRAIDSRKLQEKVAWRNYTEEIPSSSRGFYKKATSKI